MLRKIKLLFFFLFFAHGKSFTQVLELKYYGIEQGLPSSTVYQTLQDKQGFIWVATSKGIAKFDGYSFKIFSQSEGLPHNDSWYLFEDTKGRIWLSMSGSTFTYIQNDKVYTVGDVQQKNEIPNTYMEDAEGNIWIDGKIKNYIIKNNTAKEFVVPGLNRSIKLIGLSFDKKKMYLLHDHSIYAFDVKTQKLETLTADIGVFLGKVVFVKHTSDEKDKIISIYSNEVRELYPEKKTITTLNKKLDALFLNTIENGKKYYLRGLGAKNILTDLNFNILDDYEVESLKGLNSVEIDREGNTWYATKDEGLIMKTQNAKNIKNYPVVYETKKLSVNALTVDSSKTIWLGTKDGLIFKFKDNKYTLLAMNELKARPKSFNIRQMEFAQDGTLHLACDGLLLNFFGNQNQHIDSDFESKLITAGSQLRIPIKKNNVYYYLAKCLKNEKNKLYLGTSNTVCTIEREDAGLLITRHISEGTNIKSYAVQPDSKGNIWMGSPEGLFVVRNNILDTLTELKKKYPLLNQTITDIVWDEESELLWVGTEASGVFTLEQHNGNVLITDRKIGYGVNRLRIDSKKRIWVATNNGILWSRKENYNRWTRITTAHGLPTNEINDLILSDELLYLATSKGVSVVDFNKMIFNYTPPLLQFITVVVRGDTLPIGKGTVKLNYQQNDLDFRFISLSYKSAGEIIYQYRLEGIEHDSIFHSTRERSINFPKLSPGEYTLWVRAIDINGVISEESSFVFVISPPYWDTLVFKLAVIAILTLGGYLLYLYRIRKIRKEEERKKDIDKKFSEMKLTGLQEQMNPHFVFNSLNSIQSYIVQSMIYLQDTNEENQKEYHVKTLLHTANRYLLDFSELIRLFLTVSRSRYTSIKNEYDLLSKYVNLEKRRFVDKFVSEIVIDENVDTRILIPAVLLQPLVENAINHGLKNYTNEGRLSIHFFMKDQLLHIEIKDNGIGYKRSQELKKLSPSGHKSLGMNIVFERLELLNTVDNLQIKYILEDINDFNPAETGTRVEIIMKPKFA